MNGPYTFSVPLKVTVSIGTPILQSPATQTTSEPSSHVVKEGQSAPSLPAIDTGPFDLPSLSKANFHWKAALSLALASKLAYETERSVKVTCVASPRSWGFRSCEFIDVDDTQCFVALTPEIALVSFRGTESRGDWLRNSNSRTNSRLWRCTPWIPGSISGRRVTVEVSAFWIQRPKADSDRP